MGETHSRASENVVSSNPAVSAVKHESLSRLLVILYQKRTPRIKLKRIDRMNYGDFSTVVRCSSVLIMLREDESAIAEVLPDIRNVSGFVLENDCLEYKANVEYLVM